MGEDNLISLNKSYVTKDGRPVRLYAIDAGGEYPVHGAIWREDEQYWESATWTARGKYFYYGFYYVFGRDDLKELI